MAVRTRFAPSPTGMPHVGNIRTALFSWLFARHYEGTFILRIEDTDQTRKAEGSVQEILESLRWLGLDWDEGPEVGGPYGPYFQSERLHIYQPFARRLVESGHAYYCSCTPERLEAVRSAQMRQRLPPKYDRHCRDLDLPPALPDRVPVIRFKTPLEGKTRVTDLIRGEVTFDNSTLDDFILLKSDGFPTYHLANVVDDHVMDVSHVLRAEEWLPSTPRHVLLYQAFRWGPPQFAHLPLILGGDRSKLSKRQGAVSVLEYRELGYLPGALLNFLSLLGWALDDKTEIIRREDLIRYFSLEGLGKTSAIFNPEKLSWMNGVYIRNLPSDELARHARPFLDRDLPPEIPRPLDYNYLRRIMPLEQERFKTLKEVPPLTQFFFEEELTYDAEVLLGPIRRKPQPTPGGPESEPTRAALQQQVQQALAHTLEIIKSVSPFEAPALEARVRALAQQLGLSTSQLFGLLRVAVTGRTAAPPLFQTMAVLGPDRCTKRLAKALVLLENL